MYKTGEIAKMSGVSIRTIRFYDTKGLLKPSAYSASGHRLYTDDDFEKLKRILALKYLGLSLEEILNIESNEPDKESVFEMLHIQRRIIKNKINHLNTVHKAIEAAEKSMSDEDTVSWTKTVDIIKSERELRQKFIDASSLSAEIHLLHGQSADDNWYTYAYDLMTIKPTDNVLDLGGGDGALWYKNENRLPAGLNVTLTEVTHDLVDLAKKNLHPIFPHFNYEVSPLEALSFADESFDVVIANHVLFYVNDVSEVLKEVLRVLKKGGRFYTSTIDESHLFEIESLIKTYDQTVEFGKAKQLENFGFDVGKDALMTHFEDFTYGIYKDHLTIQDPKDLLRYIYSIPGDVLDIAENKKKDFEAYVNEVFKAANDTFTVTNQHILFMCQKGEA